MPSQGIASNTPPHSSFHASENVSDDGDDHASGTFQLLKSLNLSNIDTVKDLAFTSLTKKPIDDRTFLMERIIQMAAGLPASSPARDTLTHSFLSQLWTDLQHPPQSYLGPQFVFRKPDGSNNNIMWPHIGAAGQPYARSVRPQMMQPVARPEPSVIFDSVLKRKNFRPHPNKISSVLFYIASIIIHDIFRTSHTDFAKSLTSSYLDLAPLYGSNEDQQMKVRVQKDGLLKPDCFSDERVLGFPPGVGLLLIMFNRFHNQTALKLAEIDEGSRFSTIKSPPGRPAPIDADKQYDEALFQTARLITTGLYINVILKDYVRTILNLNRTNSTWNLDPRSEEGKAVFGDKIPEATGNQVSAEFNLIYRWHSTISERDERWSKGAFKELFGDRGEGASLDDFLAALRDWAHGLPTDPFERPFAHLTREASGKFKDDDLANIWSASVEDCAGAFGANHVPEIMRDVEILGIIQSRSWNLASLNEFRKYFKLQPYSTFEEINPDPQVADALRHLYGHPDNVEIYPGVIVEAVKGPLTPGSGLCTNYTISRAILSDAVALVRGDRFYTVDYTPQNLTNLGFESASYNIDTDGGSVLYKLVLSAFPNNYGYKSVYAHYPLVIPHENESILKGLGQAEFYDFGKPVNKFDPVVIRSYAGCKSFPLFNYSIPSLPNADFLLKIAGGKISPKTKSQPNLTSLLHHTLLSKVSPQYVFGFYGETTLKLIQRSKFSLVGTQGVDVIRDVVTAAVTEFSACLFGLPLTTENHSDKPLTTAKLWSLLTDIYEAIFPYQEPVQKVLAQTAVKKNSNQLRELVGENVKSVKETGFLSNLIGLLSERHKNDMTDIAAHVIKELCKTDLTSDEIVHTKLLPAAAGLSVIFANGFANLLDFYLGSGSKYLPDIQRLAALDTPEADKKLERYVLEGVRLSSTLKAHTEVPVSMEIYDGKTSVQVQAGREITVDMATANKDKTVFATPDEVILDRSLELYLPGMLGCSPIPGYHFWRPAFTAMLKIIGRLPDLRRAPGPMGEMKRVTSSNGSLLFMNTQQSMSQLYPSSMVVNWR